MYFEQNSDEFEIFYLSELFEEAPMTTDHGLSLVSLDERGIRNIYSRRSKSLSQIQIHDSC
jgi:hypothetical protein